MSEPQDPLQTSFSRCFRCTAGCLHLICGNVTLTLTPAEFLVLAEAIGAMRHQLREERGLPESHRKLKPTFSPCEPRPRPPIAVPPFINADGNDNISPGSPRAVRLSLTWKF
jgi:hypothetical protein